MCLTLLGSSCWLDYVGGMVQLILVSEASLTLSFDFEMDDKPENELWSVVTLLLKFQEISLLVRHRRLYNVSQWA